MVQSILNRCRGATPLRQAQPSQHERMRSAGLARVRLGPKEALKDPQPDRKQTAEQALKPGADEKALGHKEPQRQPADKEVYHAVSAFKPVWIVFHRIRTVTSVLPSVSY